MQMGRTYAISEVEEVTSEQPLGPRVKRLGV